MIFLNQVVWETAIEEAVDVHVVLYQVVVALIVSVISQCPFRRGYLNRMETHWRIFLGMCCSSSSVRQYRSHLYRGFELPIRRCERIWGVIKTFAAMLIRLSSASSPPPHPSTPDRRRCTSASTCAFRWVGLSAWNRGLSLSVLRRAGASESPRLLRRRRACQPFMAATLLLDLDGPMGEEDEAIRPGRCWPRVDSEVSSTRGRKPFREAIRWGLDGVSGRCSRSWCCEPASLIVGWLVASREGRLEDCLQPPTMRVLLYVPKGCK